MEEWKEYKISEVIDEISMGPFGSNIKVDNFIDSGVPVLNGSSLQGFKLNENSFNYVSQEKADSLGKANAHRGDVVITHRGTLGQIVYIPDDSKFEQYVISQSQFRLKLKKDLIRPDFFVYFFHTRLGQHRILMNASQVGVPALARPTSTFKDVCIPVPPMEKQNKVMDILHSLDDKIEVNRRINDNLEQQAQALFKSWLKKCEDEVTIGDLSLNITDYTKCEQKQVVLINSSDVTEGRFEHHNLTENKNLKGHFKKRFQKGDILYSQVRPRNRHWGYCTFYADNYLASTQLMVIRNRPDVISSILLYQYIIENKVWMDFTLRTETRSGTFPQGNYEDLSAIKVPFGADVKEITDNLENIYSLIYKNEDESLRLAELRDTLLPKLMSGELKVNEIVL
jgi:type I restriction enzyme S subunit